jgi:2-phospho-L-lactate/phosphoenolpyruvate guanylyltransferase
VSHTGPTRPLRTTLEPLHAVVPLRTLAGGKARLGEALDAEEREELVLGMLTHTLAVLGGWAPCVRVHVVSPDRSVPRLVASPTVDAVAQVGDGLNDGLRLGVRSAKREGARSVLILPADLPLLEAPALDRLLDAADAALAAGSGRPLVAIAPSDARDGTNGLLLFPTDVIAPAFGDRSFEAHVRAAAAADATLQVVTDGTLGFDLDTPEDLEVLPPGRLRELLHLGQATMGSVMPPIPRADGTAA